MYVKWNPDFFSPRETKLNWFEKSVSKKSRVKLEWGGVRVIGRFDIEKSGFHIV